MSQKNKKYLILDEDIAVDIGPSDKNWSSEKYPWFYIEDGIWHIQKNTIWDGATLAYDGPESEDKPGYPILWLSTLIHDVGCMGIYDTEDFPYTRRQVDRIFRRQMKEVGFELYNIYYRAVRHIGTFFSEVISWYRKTFKVKRRLPNHLDSPNMFKGSIHLSEIKIVKIPLELQCIPS